jgi:hypothetical protein
VYSQRQSVVRLAESSLDDEALHGVVSIVCGKVEEDAENVTGRLKGSTG